MPGVFIAQITVIGGKYNDRVVQKFLPAQCLKDLSDIINYHHESLDGSGYPEGIRGGEIPIAARIVKIADYWDAITSKRPYRDPIPVEKAMEMLSSEAGLGRVEGDFVEALFRQVEKFPL